MSSSSPERSLLEHPPFGLLVGGIVGICTARYGPGPVPLDLLVASGLAGLAIGGNLLWFRRAPFVALVAVGYGGLLLLTLFYWYPYRVKRRRLLNRRVHLVGRSVGWDSSRLRVRRVNGRPFRGTVYLGGEALGGPGEAPDENSLLTLTATVRWPFDAPGFANHLAAHRDLGYLDVHRVRVDARDPPGDEAMIPRLRASLHAGLVHRGKRWPTSTRFLRALVLGEKNALPERVEVLLRRLGISHLFVISGLHVGLLYVLLLGTLNRLGTPPRWFLPLTALFLGLYLSFLGWPVSATRAGVMVLFLAWSRAGLRRCTYSEVLASTVLVLLVYDPLMLFRVGFQLSVAAVGGIILVRERSWIQVHRPGVRWLLINLGAFLAVLPLLLFHFRAGSGWGWLSSFLAGALFPGFLVLLSLQGLLIGTLWTLPADHIEAVFRRSVELGWAHLGDLPLMLGVAELSIVGVLGWWLLMWLALDRGAGRPGRGIGLVILSGVILFFTLAPRPAHTEIGTVDGMGFLRIQTVEGEQILVLDPDRPPTSRRLGSLARRLRQRGIVHLDTVVGFSNCRRIRKRLVTLSLGRCRVSTDGRGDVEWVGGAFFWRQGRLRLPYVTIKLAPRANEGTLARVDGYCLRRSSRRPAGRSDRSRACREIDLGRNPMVWRPGRPPKRGFPANRSVGQRLLGGLSVLTHDFVEDPSTP